MKIDGSTGTPSPTDTASASVRKNKNAPQNNQSGREQDNVTLSSASSQIQALESGIAEASGFDAAKVEAIKQAISEGRFNINPELIASKLLASAQELISQQGN